MWDIGEYFIGETKAALKKAALLDTGPDTDEEEDYLVNGGAKKSIIPEDHLEEDKFAEKYFHCKFSEFLPARHGMRAKEMRAKEMRANSDQTRGFVVELVSRRGFFFLLRSLI